MSISIFKFDVGQMVCGREGEYVRRDDHERELAAKDDEIERLTKEAEEQIGYSIQLQRLLESLKREATPYPKLHHHKMVVDIKAENASLKARVERLENILHGNTREDTAEKIFAATAGAMKKRVN